MHRDPSAPAAELAAASDPRAPTERGPSRAVAVVVLVGLLLLALLVRLPALNDADFRFTSDEAVDALVLSHLLSGRELTLFNWDSTYYGIAEGLLTIPFLPLLGQSAAAFKLGAIAGHWLLMAAVYLLGARLYGRRAGLLAAAILVAFSPALLYWSTLASGGYCLVVACGTLALWQLDRVAEAPSRRRLFLLGLLCGLGFYVYQLFLVYIAAIALWELPRSAVWHLLLARTREAAGRAVAGLRSHLGLAAVAACGFALGAAPVLARLAAGTAGGGKEPSYLVAGLDAARAHLLLLVQSAAPVLLGARSWAGPRLPAAVALGLVFALLHVVGWVAAAWRALPEIAGTARRPPRAFGVRTLLVLLVPLVALLFVLSANTQDMLSNRYLLTWLTALPVLSGALLARLFRRGPLAVAAVLGVLAAPLVTSALSLRASGSLDDHWRLVRHHEPLADAMADLERRGIHDAYAPYWTAYKGTFLTHERVVVTPTNGWDRYPPYTARVDAAAREAYLFAVDPPNVSPADRATANAERERFEAKLDAAELAVERRDFGFYRVYSAVAPTRLLPAPIRRPIAALARPAAVLRPIDPPTELRAGATAKIRVEITNLSDGFWSADGIAKLAGSRRVAVCYRWLDAAGAAHTVEGVRTPLPHDVDVDGTLRLAARVDAPAAPGRYVLRLTLVQENVAWFDQATDSQTSLQIDVR